MELGFGKSPKRRSVYVNRSYEGCLWYFWDGSAQKHEPIADTDLCAIVEGLQIREGEFKGKPAHKLEVNVRTSLEMGVAGSQYRLVAGVDTAFARSIVSALLGVPDFQQPVAIVVTAGDEEGVIFGRAWQSGVETKDRENVQIRSEDDLRAAIAVINDRLGAAPAPAPARSATPGMERPVRVSEAEINARAVNGSANRDRIAEWLKLTGHAPTQAKSIRHKLLGTTKAIADYTEEEMVQLRNALFVDWGMSQQVFKALKHCQNAFVKLGATGDDAAVWEAWEQNVAERKTAAGADVELAESAA